MARGSSSTISSSFNPLSTSVSTNIRSLRSGDTIFEAPNTDESASALQSSDTSSPQHSNTEERGNQSLHLSVVLESPISESTPEDPTRQTESSDISCETDAPVQDGPTVPEMSTASEIKDTSSFSGSVPDVKTNATSSYRTSMSKSKEESIDATSTASTQKLSIRPSQMAPGTSLRVITSHQAADGDELELEIGDVVELNVTPATDEEYWWHGTNRSWGPNNGSKGYFPAECVTIETWEGVEITSDAVKVVPVPIEEPVAIRQQPETFNEASSVMNDIEEEPQAEGTEDEIPLSVPPGTKVIMQRFTSFHGEIVTKFLIFRSNADTRTHQQKPMKWS
jgi:hypothetical protein